jgi:hypothetical protein
MVTIFSIPKPFIGHIGRIQMNAIRSWALLEPKCQIVLFGDEEGIAEAAAETDSIHVAEVERNQHGTPKLDWAFSRAQQLADHRLTCYLNSDVIVFNDLPTTASRIEFPRFLMIGERTDLDVTEPLDFGDGWQERLRARSRKYGSAHGPSGMDSFVFPTGMISDMPGFVVGRAGWDNWMVYNARLSRIPVIDASRVVALVHQTHDYSHHAGPKKGTWRDPESIANLDLLDHPSKAQFLLSDATFRIRRPGGRPVRAWRHLLRALDTWPLLYPPERHASIRLLVPLYRIATAVRYVWRRFRRLASRISRGKRRTWPSAS